MASLVAVVLAMRALKDSNRTAGVLVESQRLLESAQERVEREQAARVLTVGHDLARRIQIFWQRTLVDLEAPPTPGGSHALVGHAREDLEAAAELLLRCSQIDLTAVQYARYVQWRFDFIREDLETVERKTMAASPSGGGGAADVQGLKDHWSTLRLDLIGRTVEMLEVLQRLEAHFPAAARLLRDTDAQGFLKDLQREVQQGREAKIRGVLNARSSQVESE